MNAALGPAIVVADRTHAIPGTLGAALRGFGRLLRRVGTAVSSLAARAATRARRPLSTQQSFAVLLVAAVLLYLLVLLVQPTGAGRGGR